MLEIHISSGEQRMWTQRTKRPDKEVRIHEKEIMGVRSGQLQHEEVEMKTNQEGIASLSGC